MTSAVPQRRHAHVLSDGRRADARAVLMGDNELRTALLARGSATLSLPQWATFASLDDIFEKTAEPTPLADDFTFTSHLRFSLPTDFGYGTGSKASKNKAGLEDVIHRFTIADAIAGPLNQRLKATSLSMEEAAQNARSNSAASGNLYTNWGGFQSHSAILQPRDDPIEHEQYASCRDLHAIASRALDELITATDTNDGDTEAPPADAPGGAAESDDFTPFMPLIRERHLAAEQEKKPHGAYGWINVNRASDLNFMHIHDARRWSAIYYVDGGTFDFQAKPKTEMGGRLLFRGGRSQVRM